MKRFFSRKLAALFVALVMVLALTTPISWAASCTVTFTDPSVIVGNNVTISVRLSGNAAAATIWMNYDQRYLQYVSGSGVAQGGGGSVKLDYAYDSGGAGSMNFSMTFKALKTGQTTVTCTSYDIVDTNGEDMGTNMGNSVVTINAQPTASGNNNLGSLSISPGTLSPGFSAGTTSYKAWVSNSTTSVAVSAKAADSKAKVAVWGNTGLDVGDNTVTVQVTAENGSKKTYTITVNRASGSTGGNTGGNTGGGNSQAPEDTPEPSPTATPVPDVVVTLPDDTQLPISTQLPEGVTIPQGFEEGQLEVEGQTLPVAIHKQANLTAVYLEGDEEHPAGFYFYNEKTREAVAITPVAMSSGKLTLINLPEDLAIPQGYSSTLMELGGQQHTLLTPDGVEDPNHYIVCALDEKGVMGLYLYDVEQQSYQRYQFAQTGEDLLALSEVEEEPQEEGFVFSLFGRQVTTSWSDQVVSYLLAGLALLSVVLLVVVIVLVVCLVKSRKALRQAWMREEEQRQLKIIAGPHAPGITVDEILAEYTTKDNENPEEADQGTTEEEEQTSETQDDNN